MWGISDRCSVGQSIFSTPRLGVEWDRVWCPHPMGWHWDRDGGPSRFSVPIPVGFGSPSHGVGQGQGSPGPAVPIPLGFLCPHPFGVSVSPSLSLFRLSIPRGHRGTWGRGLPTLWGQMCQEGTRGQAMPPTVCRMWGCRIGAVPHCHHPDVSHMAQGGSQGRPAVPRSGAGCGAGCCVHPPMALQNGAVGVPPSIAVMGQKEAEKG